MLRLGLQLTKRLVNSNKRQGGVGRARQWHDPERPSQQRGDDRIARSTEPLPGSSDPFQLAGPPVFVLVLQRRPDAKRLLQGDSSSRQNNACVFSAVLPYLFSEVVDFDNASRPQSRPKQAVPVPGNVGVFGSSCSGPGVGLVVDSIFSEALFCHRAKPPTRAARRCPLSHCSSANISSVEPNLQLALPHTSWSTVPHKKPSPAGRNLGAVAQSPAARRKTFPEVRRLLPKKARGVQGCY